MKIPYGTRKEKTFLCGAFLLAAAASAVALHDGRMLSFPHLNLPLYLALCALVLAFLPSGQASGDPLSRALYRSLPALFLMSAIFYTSSLTFPSDTSVALPDLLFHFAEFFALGLLTARMVAPNLGGRPLLRGFLPALFIVTGYALLDEIHQGFVPGRDPSGLDFMADALGGFFGILGYGVLFTGPGNNP